MNSDLDSVAAVCAPSFPTHAPFHLHTQLFDSQQAPLFCKVFEFRNAEPFAAAGALGGVSACAFSSVPVSVGCVPVWYHCHAWQHSILKLRCGSLHGNYDNCWLRQLACPNPDSAKLTTMLKAQGQPAQTLSYLRRAGSLLGKDEATTLRILEDTGATGPLGPIGRDL